MSGPFDEILYEMQKVEMKEYGLFGHSGYNLLD